MKAKQPSRPKKIYSKWSLLWTKTTSGQCYLHIQPSKNDVNGEETKLPLRNSITFLCKSNCVGGPPSLPWLSKENLKTGETFLLSSHIKVKENLPSYQLSYHDIESEHNSCARLPLHGEFSYKPLYWEWLEDILIHSKDKLTIFHLFDALYASLFLYNQCSNLIRVVCESIETNTLYTSEGEVSLCIFDIRSFLGLPLLGCLYDEVIPIQRELMNKLPRSCTYLFTFHHKLMQGPNKYHVYRKSNQGNQIPHLGILSSIIKVGACGWVDCQVIFDELGVAIGQCTEIFQAAFLSCWLCTFILLVRDADCIHPDTFSVASFMTSGVGYCLPTVILASIYKGLNEISRSLHPSRSGGYFPANFVYVWLAKNIEMYKLVSEVSSSPSMVKFSSLGQAESSKMPENSLVLGGAFVGFHPSSTNLRKLSWMAVSYQELTLLILSAFVRVLSLTVVRTTSTIAATNPVDNSVSIRMFLRIWTSTIFLIQKQCFTITTCSRAMEQGLKSCFLGDAMYSREIPLTHFVNGGPRCSFP
ncbi:LOW QUALITY PROTEIN: hypothetical protein Cgig2_023155 [Carnegiea gigantea]|uniref:Aminotransferase-like plant mobile domain-containing protein n=1 Tax=Carnegiea gigantea TaxID=171969 RepID=A0A9Q1KEW4_9CARY|nr:LOW QUALITY PROTEIN: hypothetical protein Cgig2_023155 [Carnegiea gigantea]